MSRRAFHREERGAAAAEFALILPLMLLLVFGFFEAGRLYWSYNTVQAAARDAARFAARLPISCDAGGAGTLDDGADQAKIQQLARTGTPDGSGAPLVAGWTDDASVDVQITCVENSGGALAGRYEDYSTIPTVKVIADAPYGALFGGLFPGLTLTSVAVENAQAWTL